jgi:uncharacterized protein (DUF885 family)
MIGFGAVLIVTSSLVEPLANEYLGELWKSSPIAATQAGYHGESADTRLDDRSAAARARRVAWLHGFRERLMAVTARVRGAHSFEDQADEALLTDAVALELADLERIRAFERRCDLPLESLGSVFFFMAARGYAPLDRRVKDVTARLQQVPRFLAEVRAGLTTHVPIYREAARDDGEGLIDFFEHDLPTLLAEAGKQPALRAAIAEAVRAVRGYLEFVDQELPKRPQGSHRLGAELYALRFAPYLQTDRSPAQVLAAASQRRAAILAEMSQLARRIVPSGDVRTALAKVAEDHPRPETFLDTCRQALEDARKFVEEKHLVTLVGRRNLEVVETPAFLRSQLGVAAFDPAPPLRPELGAFYYVTPFPHDWPPEKMESKLREYNRPMIDLLTIHEAMPGHYVQAEHANGVQPVWRRVLRAVLGANSYIEGWAVHAQDLMVDAGYRGGDPRLRLQALKFELRGVLNAILDIKLHTQELSDEAALELMIKDGFQERTEAEQKLRRAKLSETQLCSYFVGGEAWKEIRAEATRRAHGKLDLRAFYDRALGVGPITLPMLRALVNGL